MNESEFEKRAAEIKGQIEKQLADRLADLKKEALADATPTFKEGEWIHLDYLGRTHTLLFDGMDGERIKMKAYINPEGEWQHNNIWGTLLGCKNVRKLTTEEIQAALVAEATKRGFKEGAVVNCIKVDGSDKNYTLHGGGFFMDKSYGDDTLRLGGAAIYAKGQWAEIIAEKEIKIGGYVVHIEKDFGKTPYTTIDCHVFQADFWKAAKTVAEHSKAKIKIGCSHQFDLSLETINAILDKL